jgi:hypothetical protein
MTAWRIFENFGFSWRESGVGGMVEEVPRAISGFGGSVGRRVRMCPPGAFWFGKTYCGELACDWGAVESLLTMYGLVSSVEIALLDIWRIGCRSP